jgi:pre-mRNA-processing factor 19
MSMLCAISGTVPEHPTVSKKTGHVFERSLITKYVSETGKCPITGVELTEDDLLPLATNKTIKPRSSAATSIPGLLGLFHDEWDALMLEHHTLRQNLHTVSLRSVAVGATGIEPARAVPCRVGCVHAV